MISFENRLKSFQQQNNIYTKGLLSFVIQFTRMVQGKNFPLDSNDFRTQGKGQIAGLSGQKLKKYYKSTVLLSSCQQKEGELAEEIWG